jgi:hypothetical protein
MYFIKHKLNLMFDGIKCPLLFGSGHSNVSLGRKFGAALSRLGSDLISIELDLSMCETTMRGPLLQLEGMVYSLLGLTSSEVDFLLKHPLSYGKSSKRHLRFKIPFCRESGTANTTVGNTIVFSTCLLAAMRSMGILDSQWLCLVGGDDACIYTSLNLLYKFERGVELVSKLGLKPEAIIHDNIYSGRFYGGRMIQYLYGSDLVWAHTPLIGRCLTKNNCIKYSGQHNPLTWLRDVTVARFYEWGHVPILGPINRAISRYPFPLGKCNIPLPYKDIFSEHVILKPCFETWLQFSQVYSHDVSTLMSCEEEMFLHFSSNWIGKQIVNQIIEDICCVDLK